jgi:hypothetical protein
LPEARIASQDFQMYRRTDKWGIFITDDFFLFFSSHIREEFDGIYSEQEIQKMNPEERAFTWFQ